MNHIYRANLPRVIPAGTEVIVDKDGKRVANRHVTAEPIPVPATAPHKYLVFKWRGSVSFRVVEHKGYTVTVEESKIVRAG